MNKTRCLLLALSLCLLVAESYSQLCDVYIAKDGIDQPNCGGDFDPCASLQGSLESIRNTSSSGGSCDSNANWRIIVREGNYVGAENSNIVFDLAVLNNFTLMCAPEATVSFTQDGSSNKLFEVIGTAETGITFRGITFQGQMKPLSDAVPIKGGCVSILGELKYVTVEESVFNGCSTSDSQQSSGGAMYINKAATVGISNTIFSMNSAAEGGALTVKYSYRVSLSRCFFVSNTANVGGAISSSTFLDMDTVEFLDNYAINNGGAININNAKLNIINSNFYNSSCHGGGGAIALQRATFTDTEPAIKNCTFKEGSAVSGGALFIVLTTGTSDAVIISENVFERNNASFGGAIFVSDGSSLIVSNSTFNYNIGFTSGGSIYIEKQSQIVIEDSSLQNSTCDQGGIVSCWGGDVSTQNTYYGSHQSDPTESFFNLDDTCGGNLWTSCKCNCNNFPGNGNDISVLAVGNKCQCVGPVVCESTQSDDSSVWLWVAISIFCLCVLIGILGGIAVYINAKRKGQQFELDIEDQE